MRILCLLFCFLQISACQGSISQIDIPDRETPAIVSEKDFPSQKEYFIRTRLVIEFMTFKNDQEKLVTMYGGTPEQITKEFKYTEKLYKDLGLKFQITQVAFQQYDIGAERLFLDAMRYPEYLSVYYMLPQPFPYDGMSSAPWEIFKWGILLSGSRQKWTLAHEIGHYFGLLHTFVEDFCDDTAKQDNKTCELEPYKLPNCNNIMNYCFHGNDKILSANQKDRVLRFLRATRRTHVVANASKKSRDLESMYNELFKITMDQANDEKTDSDNSTRRPGNSDQ